MSITTKTGDTGKTRLFSGEKISKNAPQTQAYGDIDELVSILGIVRASSSDSRLGTDIMTLQTQLFTVGAELATTPSNITKLTQRIDMAIVAEMDAKCQTLESQIIMPKTFILPGGTLTAAYIDMARAVSRRCERQIVALHDAQLIDNAHMLIWINRVSDYLWLLARYHEGHHTQELTSSRT
jgi:cob(I)alamin adenosyltransferase